nr:MAG TPA: hypothetical protein [Caudoviricetes sp.]DAY23477.1 MAG TPA: hypothetical protein [Caudoviricetes sp.]
MLFFGRLRVSADGLFRYITAIVADTARICFHTWIFVRNFG